MKPTARLTTLVAPALLAVLFALLAAGCNFDVPLTAAPTRTIDERLVGNWTSADGKEKMHIRKYDEHTLVLSYDGDLLRAWHSDLDGVPFVSVQCLDNTEHPWLYVNYRIENNGRRLALLNVRDKLFPKGSVKTSQEAQALVRKNLKDPELFGTGDDRVGIYNRD